jgi:hypothetical protein
VLSPSCGCLIDLITSLEKAQTPGTPARLAVHGPASLRILDEIDYLPIVLTAPPHRVNPRDCAPNRNVVRQKMVVTFHQYMGAIFLTTEPLSFFILGMVPPSLLRYGG